MRCGGRSIIDVQAHAGEPPRERRGAKKPREAEAGRGHTTSSAPTGRLRLMRSKFAREFARAVPVGWTNPDAAGVGDFVGVVCVRARGGSDTPVGRISSVGVEQAI